MTPILRVRQTGVLDTIQDLGRPHAQRYGVPIGGAMDRFALIAANKLVGNPSHAAALELTAGGTVLELLAPRVLAVTGADLGVRLDESLLPLWTAIYARAGQEIRFTHRQQPWGARTYLAVCGGIDVPEVLGARGTCLPGAFGGLNGRPLRAGDVLAASSTPIDNLRIAGRSWPATARPPYAAQPTLHILLGPHFDLFTDAARTALLDQHWQIGQQSNRIGYRLVGNVLPAAPTESIASHGVIPGALQVPPDGAPILLMADAQTTGGYPIIAVVSGADLPLAAQLLPGDQVRFGLTTLDESLSAWRTFNHWLAHVFPQDAIVTQLDWAAAIAADL